MKKYFILSLLLLLAVPFVAQAEPVKFTKPITIYTAMSTGAPSDIMLRMITGRMQKELGVNINVIPTVGGSGAACMLKALSKAHDGHSYAFNSSWKLTAADIFRQEKVAYGEMIPVAIFGQNSFRLVSKAGVYKDFNDFIEKAKQNPGKVNIGIFGSKTSNMAALLVPIQQQYGVKFNLITFQDSGSITAATLGGHVNAAIFPTTMGGSDVLLNVTGYDAPALKGVPTLASLGKEASTLIPDMSLMAAADCPKDVLEAFSVAFYKAMSDYPELDDIARKTDWFLTPNISMAELQKSWELDRAVIIDMHKNGYFDISE